MGKKIKVVLLKAGEKARAAEIDNTLESFQAIVEGYIEVVCLDEAICLICNEEGKITGKPLNRGLRDKDGEIMDIVAGTCFICRANDEGENISLTEEQVARYIEMFKYPEDFFRIGDRIVACPYGNEEGK